MFFLFYYYYNFLDKNPTPDIIIPLMEERACNFTPQLIPRILDELPEEINEEQSSIGEIIFCILFYSF
jgi:hypothetical protein